MKLTYTCTSKISLNDDNWTVILVLPGKDTGISLFELTRAQSDEFTPGEDVSVSFDAIIPVEKASALIEEKKPAAKVTAPVIEKKAPAKVEAPVKKAAKK